MKTYPYIIVKFQNSRVIEKILKASVEKKWATKKDQESTLQAKKTWKIAFNTELEENEEIDLKYWRKMIYNLEFDTKNINQLWRWD